MKLDLNCDLGEGEPRARTRELLRWITSANVACGGHAGDLKSMEGCVRLAKQFRVRLGAHPGSWDRGDFGRGSVRITPDELELLLLQQVGALERIARAHHTPLHHIKLHGALYHLSETDAALGRRYVESVARWWPSAKIYARAGGKIKERARTTAVEVWEEVFADRAYRDDGSLVPRAEPGAVVSDRRAVTERTAALLKKRQIVTVSGQPLRLHAQTLCVHSDTPDAARLARYLAELVR